MKKVALLIALVVAPFIASAQSPFSSFEDDKDVTSVVVTKNMFKLLSKIDIESDDKEVAEYMELVNNLDNIQVYTTDNPAVAAKMNASVKKYIAGNSKLSELMRVKDDGKNIKFYSKEGKNENFVSELLMFMDGNVDGKDMSVVLSITGNIDLKKISKLTRDLNVPGSKELENLDKN